MKVIRCISVVALVALGGCGAPAEAPTPETSSQPGQLFPNWPPLLNDFRFHWTAEPGIDVTTGPAIGAAVGPEAEVGINGGIESILMKRNPVAETVWDYRERIGAGMKE